MVGSNQFDKELFKTLTTVLQQEKEGKNNSIQKQLVDNSKDKDKTITKDNKIDKAASQAVDLNQKNQIQMQPHNKHSLVQGQSIGSKNNNSSGLSGYLNSNSNSKSTAEKIQENLKEIKFIPIIFTLCPNNNSSQTKETMRTLGTDRTPMTITPERRREEGNSNLLINNVGNIQPIVNIESQILAVMQHFSKKQPKDIKDKKNEVNNAKMVDNCN